MHRPPFGPRAALLLVVAGVASACQSPCREPGRAASDRPVVSATLASSPDFAALEARANVVTPPGFDAFVLLAGNELTLELWTLPTSDPTTPSRRVTSDRYDIDRSLFYFHGDVTITGALAPAAPPMLTIVATNDIRCEVDGDEPIAATLLSVHGRVERIVAQ